MPPTTYAANTRLVERPSDDGDSPAAHPRASS
jgi:hypothetical protein